MKRSKNGTVYFPFLSPSWHYIKPINHINNGTYISPIEIYSNALKQIKRLRKYCRLAADWPSIRPKASAIAILALHFLPKMEHFLVPSTH